MKPSLVTRQHARRGLVISQVGNQARKSQSNAYPPRGQPCEKKSVPCMAGPCRIGLVKKTADHIIIIIIIIRQPLCPVVGRRPQHAVSKLPCLVLSSAISCRSSICPGRLSIAWLVSLVVFSCHMVSNW